MKLIAVHVIRRNKKRIMPGEEFSIEESEGKRLLALGEVRAVPTGEKKPKAKTKVPPLPPEKKEPDKKPKAKTKVPPSIEDEPIEEEPIEK